MNDRSIVIGAGLLLALLLSRRANAAAEPVVSVHIPEPPSFDWVAYENDFAPAYPAVDEQDEYMNTPEARLRAFLYMIRAAEHTRADAESNESYQTFYGGSRFVNMSDHPVLTREKVGVKLPDRFCLAAGFAPGCVSTAAGAYQIIRPTWQRVRQLGDWGPFLFNFTAANQDEAARRLLFECGALMAVYSGDFRAAVKRAAKIWASLPGSTAKQGGRTLAQVQSFYDEGLRIA